MAKLAILGLGAMGVRMARRLVSAGNEVVVWNRTIPTADAVPGATIGSSPRSAATGADAVIAMVRDDAASRAVWLDPDHGALAGLSAHALAIESSTLTPGWARDWATEVGKIGGIAVEAPVSGSRPQADAGQLVYFLGGEAEDIAQARPLLTPLGHAFHHVGAVGAGAVIKLVTNSLLALQVGAWSELLPLMQREGLDIDGAVTALSTTSSFAPVGGYLLSLMHSANHAPQFPIELIAKDMAYVTSIGAPGDLPLAETMVRRFAAAIDAGLGGENMSALVKLARP
ncbi:NAD(P)-dependent oxidoreductase [Neorhizobium sp. NCHU2750]|uniref:NAD(P)-dependent oxidoreductase n=1 Tax=Neorhizobium sp. NCHU2750 TaxID=1825976 RepID=UPI000EB6A959|nr:3-hydroxyisobutyrate dehydrogenase [Neorhizobium sp. NCHU2750]